MADFKNPQHAWTSDFDLWRQDFESAPPAYHSLLTSSPPQRFSEHETADFVSCCAFARLNAITHPSNHHVFHRTPQLRLIGWVVLCRATDDSLSSEQRFSCPLASCDAQFSENEHMQLVNHLSACRHLAEGEYLCPYHGTVENFMSPTTPPHSHRASKRHFLKRTIGKICRLGARRHSHAIDVQVESSDAGDGGRRTQSTASNKRPRLDQISSPIVSRPIVHAPVFPTPLPPPPSLGPPPAELQADDIHVPELEGWVGPTLTAPPCLDSYQELPATEHIPRPQEMEATSSYPAWDVENRFSNSSWASASDSVFTENTRSPVSPISRDSYFSMDGFDCPVSNAELSQYKHTPVAGQSRSAAENEQVDEMVNLSLAAPPPRIPPPIGRKSPKPIPSIRVDTSFSTTSVRPIKPSSPFSSSNSSFESPTSDSSEARDSGLFFGRAGRIEQASNEVKNPRHLVSELRGLFNTLFKVSLQKLCSDPSNTTGRRMLSWNASPAVLFERGMVALQKVVNGEMPGDISGIFGMSLLTYACGLADVDFSMPDQFSSIFEEQLRWSCAIEDHADRDLYTKLIHQLWAPDDWDARKSLPFAGDCDFMGDATIGPDRGFMGWDTWNNGTNLHDGMELPFEAGPSSYSWERPASACLNGAAIGLCQRFLDNFEYLMVDLNELNIDVQATPDFGLGMPTEIADPSTMNHEILMANVIRPLASNPALLSFMSVVEKASLLLDTFPNMPLRNTELSLMQEGKDHTAPLLLRQAFTSEVQRLANSASNVLGCGTGYRSYYYSRDVDKILALHSELLALESQTTNLGPHVQRSRSSSLSSDEKGKAPTPAQVSSYPPTLTSVRASINSPTTSSYSAASSLPSTPIRPWSADVAISEPGSSGIFHSRNNSNEEMYRIDPLGFDELGRGMENNCIEGMGSVNPTTLHSAPTSFTSGYYGHGNGRAQVHAYSVPSTRAPSRPVPVPMPVRVQAAPKGRQRRKARRSPAPSGTGSPASAPTSVPALAPKSQSHSPSTSVSAMPTSSPTPPVESGTSSVSPAPGSAIIAAGAGLEEKATQSCHICGQRFAGKAQWIRANVTRHVREKHRGTARRLVCGEPRCRYSSTRRGNVDHHRRTVHGIGGLAVEA